jgi:kynurenine formamidase
MDAPGHFKEDGRFASQLRPSELVLPIVVIEISRRARRDPDTVAGPTTCAGSRAATAASRAARWWR